MRRLPTMLSSASAAALAALAVTVAAPAIGDDGNDEAPARLPDKPGLVFAGPGPDELIQCMEENGADVPGDDPRAFKQWLGEHHDDKEVEKALEECGLPPKPPEGAVVVECHKSGSGKGARKRAEGLPVPPPPEWGVRVAPDANDGA